MSPSIDPPVCCEKWMSPAAATHAEQSAPRRGVPRMIAPWGPSPEGRLEWPLVELPTRGVLLPLSGSESEASIGCAREHRASHTKRQPKEIGRAHGPERAAGAWRGVCVCSGAKLTEKPLSPEWPSRELTGVTVDGISPRLFPIDQSGTPIVSTLGNG